jgi:MarR family 2-MHQ and catechol resistance regulon transcriptional repressor
MMRTKYGRKFYEVTNCIHHQMLDFEDTHKRTHKLGRVECNLLQFLINYDRPVSLKEIRQYINVSNSRITHLTDSLIAKGYIERITCPSDRRIYLVKITDDGFEIAQQFQSKQIKIYDEIINELSEEEYHEMFDTLEKWRQFLKKMKFEMSNKGKKIVKVVFD